MYACSYGAAFGAIQHLPRIVPGLAEVARLPRPVQEQIVSAVQGFQDFLSHKLRHGRPSEKRPQ